MPLYMDVHTIDGGVSADDVAEAHMADLQTEGKYDVRYLRYWVDEGNGKVFCLVDAPSPDVATTVHREAHGLVADAIFEVTEGT
jgi:Nickel responsive protein SCO4226-like